MLERSIPPDFDLDAFSVGLGGETDRACAVLGAALLDEKLKSLFVRRLRDGSKKLFQKYGALSTFSSRIDMARALSWISEDVQVDLDQIRDIRNDFAHHVDHKLSFANQSIAARCRNLLVAQVMNEALELAASMPHPIYSAEAARAISSSMYGEPRRRFEVTVYMLTLHMDQLPGHALDFEGPDLRSDVWALGVRMNPNSAATPAPTRTESKPSKGKRVAMMIVTSFPGQGLRLTHAPEHLVKELLAGKTFPFIRRATQVEIDTGSPMSDEHADQKRINEDDPRWGSW
jgi:hypothetical protein